MNLQQVNLDDLKSEYFDNTGAKDGTEFFIDKLQSWEPMRLGNLLRYHSPKGVYQRSEKQRRGQMDDFLNACSVLEIASLISFIPCLRPGGEKFCLTLQRILENRQVEKYFTEHYPLTLPQLLRLRLRGSHTLSLDPTRQRITFFIEFLTLDQRFRRIHENDDPDDVRFLDLLDDFYRDDYDFDSFVRDLKNPSKVVRSVLLPPAKRKFSHEILNEFLTFMQFCFDLLDLLKRMEREPLLQSAIWNHYRYWFVIIGEDLRNDLEKAINQFSKWEPRENARAVTQQIQSYMGDARRTIRDLTSQKFAAPVDALLAKCEKDYRVVRATGARPRRK